MKPFDVAALATATAMTSLPVLPMADRDGGIFGAASILAGFAWVVLQVVKMQQQTAEKAATLHAEALTKSLGEVSGALKEHAEATNQLVSTIGERDRKLEAVTRKLEAATHRCGGGQPHA